MWLASCQRNTAKKKFFDHVVGVWSLLIDFHLRVNKSGGLSFWNGAGRMTATSSSGGKNWKIALFFQDESADFLH
jgi:hypothetical protein